MQEQTDKAADRLWLEGPLFDYGPEGNARAWSVCGATWPWWGGAGYLGNGCRSHPVPCRSYSGGR